MMPYGHDRVVRRITGALVGCLSNQELHEVADRLVQDQQFQQQLYETLHKVAMVLKSQEHVPTRSSQAEKELPDRQRMWLHEARELLKRKRMSKRGLVELITDAFPTTANSLSEEQTLGEILATFARKAPENQLRDLLHLLQMGARHDPYLKGIMARTQGRGNGAR